MKIVYTSRYEERYLTNPVENPDRVRLAAEELRRAGYELVEPSCCTIEDLSRVHGREHIELVRRTGPFEAACWAVGGAIRAAEIALSGEPAFALVRPPGHHASANRAWGMCFFNNIAVALKRVRSAAREILIIDMDLHYGDGTVGIFRGDSGVRIVNPGSVDANFDYLTLDADGYKRQIESALDSHPFELLGVSAGFDTYIEDWGGLLSQEDYEDIGWMLAEASRRCSGRRFAVLEGGYHPDLRFNIIRFIKGFSEDI